MDDTGDAAPTLDWNSVGLAFITTGLGEIPMVGGILAALVSLFWPKDQPDLWSQVADQAQKMVDQAIAQEVIDSVQTTLADLHNVLVNYQDTLLPDGNGEDSHSMWDAANSAFIGSVDDFQQEDYQAALLPLFAQFANLHLALLRDGAQRGFCTAAALTGDSSTEGPINAYSDYVTTWLTSAISGSKLASFNDLNVYSRSLTTSVAAFSVTWPYFAPGAGSVPRSVLNSVKIWYTATESMPLAGNPPARQPEYEASTSSAYQGEPDTPVSNIVIHWLEDATTHRIKHLVQGAQVTYGPPDQGLAYVGVLKDGQPPPVAWTRDPPDGFLTWQSQAVPVPPDNPVVGASGVYDSSGAVYSVAFTFQDGTSCATIPAAAYEAYPYPYTVSAPRGFVLCSINVPTASTFYQAAHDIVFGFKLDPAPPPSTGPTSTT